jgi:hypothetical protein
MMEDREILELIQQTNRLNKWIPKQIFLQFNESQYKALMSGYNPHWEMRYGIQFEDGYFYNYRSGWIVGKFKVEKIEDNLYQVTEMYDNPEKSDWKVVFDSIVEACIQNHVFMDRDSLQLMQKKTYEMQEENQ